MMAMLRWGIDRLILALPVVAGVTALTFTLVHLAPGDPIDLLAGDGGSPAYYAEMRAKYGLDRSLGEQFVRYTRTVLSGDLGYSFLYQAPVTRVIFEHLPASLLLGFSALALATVTGFGAGVLTIVVRSPSVDRVVRLTSSLAYAAPVFWTGQVLMLVFALRLRALPVGGMTTARETLSAGAWLVDVGYHLVLPAVTLALPFIAVVARVTRASVFEVAREPFVTASYARGIPRRRVILRHIVPNAVVPVVALVGQHAAQLAAGAALTEALFGWPGVGYVVLHASLHRDYPLVTASFMVIASSVVLFNIVTDAVCVWLDPRIARGR